MRTAFKIQYEFGATPIEQIELPLDSRDELPQCFGHCNIFMRLPS